MLAYLIAFLAAVASRQDYVYINELPRSVDVIHLVIARLARTETRVKSRFVA